MFRLLVLKGDVESFTGAFTCATSTIASYRINYDAYGTPQQSVYVRFVGNAPSTCLDIIKMYQCTFVSIGVLKYAAKERDTNCV